MLSAEPRNVGIPDATERPAPEIIRDFFELSRRIEARDEREEEGLVPGSIWSRVWRVGTGVEGFNRERGIWTLWTLGDEIGIVVG